MIVPAEADDALATLRGAREALGAAIDELNLQHGSNALIATLRTVHDATAWAVDELAAAVKAAEVRARELVYMEAVEERHVDCQTFPWAELDS